MNVEEAVADLRATVDYLRALTEQSDSLDLDELVAVQDELRRVKHHAGETISLFDTALLKRLEGGVRQVGDRVFARSKQYVSRHDHGLIAQKAIEHAIDSARDPDTGDVNTSAALQTLVSFMKRVYLTPSTKAKVSVLEALGIGRDDYESKEFKGWTVSVTELDER